MNGITISKLLKKDPLTRRIFHGFASPDVPIKNYIKKYPCLVVMNTGISSSPGEHWVVLIIERGGVCYFFDSYGHSPEEYGLMTTSLEHCESIKYNTRQVQQNTSETCGPHCIYFAVQYARGNNPEDIVRRKYTLDLKKNDQMVLRFVERRMK